ncbi:hypothetical protein DPMN_031785 [Dreissena polymorpha]|uniref:Uncharacterized protein n=1 Tax=Dreissena polymorpha TaxID=45954 RepID=A0A9D4RHM7_DREPO|nr:hypothetical protein DPMN_031785 [Dreissena polymorpha]
MVEELLFNLKTETVHVMSFDNTPFEPGEVVERARRRIDEKYHHITYNKSPQFVKWAKAGKHVPWIRLTPYGTLHYVSCVQLV